VLQDLKVPRDNREIEVNLGQLDQMDNLEQTDNQELLDNKELLAFQDSQVLVAHRVLLVAQDLPGNKDHKDNQVMLVQ
jgi:hypothetical protein